MIKCQAVEDPTLWKNFPVRLTPSNWDSFLEMKRLFFLFINAPLDCDGFLCGNIRLAKAEYVEVELPSCNKIGCEVHPEKEWPVLDQIKTFLGTNLKKMIIRLSNCEHLGSGGLEWIRDFAFDVMDDEITTCVTWPPIDEDVWARYFFYWGENTASTSLFNPLPSYGSSKLHYSFQNSLLAAVAAAALCLIVYYCHENHLCHPHLGAPPKWDSCTTKMGQDRPSRHYK